MRNVYISLPPIYNYNKYNEINKNTPNVYKMYKDFILYSIMPNLVNILPETPNEWQL